MSQIVRLVVNRGYGLSLGNLIQRLDIPASAEVEESWIEVKEVSPNLFKVVNDNMTEGDDWVHDSCALCFCDWDDEVANLDHVSDAADCYGMSERLIWRGAILTPWEFYASSVDLLREALEHVVFCAWCPGDV